MKQHREKDDLTSTRSHISASVAIVALSQGSFLLTEWRRDQLYNFCSAWLWKQFSTSSWRKLERILLSGKIKTQMYSVLIDNSRSDEETVLEDAGTNRWQPMPNSPFIPTPAMPWHFHKSHEPWTQHWEYRGVTPKWLSFHHSAEWDLKVEIKFSWEIRDENYISCKLAVWTKTQTQTLVICWYSAPPGRAPITTASIVYEKNLQDWRSIK